MNFNLYRYMRVKVKSFSHVRLFATPWTVAHEAPPEERAFYVEHLPSAQNYAGPFTNSLKLQWV